MKETVAAWGNRLFEALVLAAVAWSTLALGGAWGWGLAVTFGLLSAAFCLWVGLRLLCGAEGPREATGAGEKPVPPLPVGSPLAWGLILGLGAYAILHVIPLPVPVVKLLSPVRVARELPFREALGEPAPRTLTLAVDGMAAQRALSLVAVAVMAFAAGAYLSARRERIRRVMRVLLILALVEALYGLAENLSGHAYLFWIPVGGDFARGTFFNRNHFAATLALFFPVTVGWFYFRAAAARARHERTERLPATSLDVLQSRQGLWLLPPAVLLAGIIQSQSRGGFAALVFATALLFALGGRSRSARAVSWLGVPLALALFAYGLSSDYATVLERFGELTRNVNAEGRTTIWRDSLGIVRDYPLFGVGLGNFPRVFMQYASTSTLVYPSMAHNEWLEGLITLGGIGMGLAVIALAGLFVGAFRRLRRTGRDYPWLLGCWCGLAGLAFHSCAEFNLHIPSITVTAALLAGVLLGFNRPAAARNGRSTDGTRTQHGRSMDGAWTRHGRSMDGARTETSS